MDDINSNNGTKKYNSSRRRSMVPDPMPEEAREEINSECEKMEVNFEKKDLHKMVKQRHRQYIRGLDRLKSNHIRNEEIHMENLLEIYDEDCIDQEDKDFMIEVENAIENYSQNIKNLEDMKTSMKLIKKSNINNLATIKLLDESKNESKDYEKIIKNSDKILPTILPIT